MNAKHVSALVLGGLGLVACAKAPPPAPVPEPAAPAAGRGARPAAAALAPLALASCTPVGPAACALQPAQAPALCAGLTGCVKSPPELSLEGYTLDCERSGTPAQALTAREQPAPSGSGVLATSVVDTYAYDDMTALFGASYLTARFEGGWCLVDTVLDWELHRSYFRIDVATRWEQAGGGLRLSVEAHRVAHESLDQEELAEGTSDVTSEVCSRISYEVSGGSFRRVTARATEGACTR